MKNVHVPQIHIDRHADFTRDRRIIILSALAILVGIVGAFIASALVWLIGTITNLAYYQKFSAELISPANNHLGVWMILIPIAGSLIIGLTARYGSEQIRGHGIPEALEAILIGRSKMSLKIAILKPLTSAISIGTGGPFGAEGPIIMTGGAFGSLFAQIFNLSSAERKTLLVAGAAAGMSAIFSAPLAAVLLAVELLLFEWKPRSFIPVAFASVVASALRIPLLGKGPIFPITPHVPLGGAELLIALLVGMLAGLGSGLLTTLVYGFEDVFRKLPIHWMWWPAIGGLFVGIGGLINPQALGVGYDTIRLLLNGQLIGAAAISLLVVKMLIWSIALGSGTSGGVLAPLLIMGGALGAIEAHWIPVGDPGLWALISMAAIMGGTMRSPLTAIVFMLELTHDLNVLPGLLVACVAAEAVTVMLMRRSILTEKVARRGLHLTREYSVGPHELTRVNEVMDANPMSLPGDMTAGELHQRIQQGDPQFNHLAWPILDAQDRLVGIITRKDVNRVVQEDMGADRPVRDVGSRKLAYTFPDELLVNAMTQMLEKNLGRLLVVDREDPSKLVGYLGRQEVLLTWMRWLSEERVPEGGWLAEPAHRLTRLRRFAKISGGDIRNEENGPG